MAEERVQRKLAAILAADVVGYARLMEGDEQLTRARLRSLHHELIDPRIAAADGRIVKTMGDGVLVEFPSVVDAVHCALAIQSELQRRNAFVAEDNRIDFRMGINVGDVIIEGDDIHGDGINIAARLEGLCEPGEVYVSSAVYEQVAGKVAVSFDALGEQTVKNITKPVTVYRVIDRTKMDTGRQARIAGPSPVISDKPSIAVLPFDNLSDDPQQEYFSDGMAEDLITDISKISGVSVAARNSSFAFKGQPADVKDIARKLGVRHIVEGSVRKMGDRLRINCQLIDGSDGRHIWAERYDGNMAEIFDFQDDIRAQIVSALRVNLTPSDKALTERRPTDSVAAYDLFLKGRASFYRYTPEDLLEAIKCFEQAIEIDPNFADAYSYLSYCNFAGWIYMWPGFDNTLDRANDWAEKGVALDGTSAIALTRLGWIQTFMRQHDEAIANLEKAFALAPDNPEVNATFAQVLNYWGDPEKALEMMETAFHVDSIGPPSWQYHVGLSHMLLRQYDEAASRFLNLIERAPKYTPGYLLLADAYVELDRLDEARDAIEMALQISPRHTVKEIARFYPYRNDQFRNRLFDNLRKAGMPEG